MLSYVMARKLAQKYVTVNLSIVLNIANSKDVIINKKHCKHSTKCKFLWENWELLKWIFSYIALSILMLSWKNLLVLLLFRIVFSIVNHSVSNNFKNVHFQVYVLIKKKSASNFLYNDILHTIFRKNLFRAYLNLNP